MIDIKFNSKYQILYVTFSGSTDFEDIRHYITKIKGLNLSIDFLDVIHDMREIDYRLSPDRIGKVLELAESISSKYRSIRVASVHQNAHSTAISTIIRERLDIPNVEYQVYSTLEAALDWLKVKKIDQQVG